MSSTKRAGGQVGFRWSTYRATEVLIERHVQPPFTALQMTNKYELVFPRPLNILKWKGRKLNSTAIRIQRTSWRLKKTKKFYSTQVLVLTGAHVKRMCTELTFPKTLRKLTNFSYERIKPCVRTVFQKENLLFNYLHLEPFFSNRNTFHEFQTFCYFGICIFERKKSLKFLGFNQNCDMSCKASIILVMRWDRIRR